MDYKDYRDNMMKYYALEGVSFQPEQSQEEVLRQLMENANKKKEIKLENDEILEKYLIQYEEHPELIDDSVAQMLEAFCDSLMQGTMPMDLYVTLHIARILLKYYEKTGNREMFLRYLARYCQFELMLKEHLEMHEGSEYAQRIRNYKDWFDELPDGAKHNFITIYSQTIFTRKHMAVTLDRYKEIRSFYEEKKDSFGTKDKEAKQVMLNLTGNLLAFMAEIGRRMSYNRIHGIKDDEDNIDFVGEADFLRERYHEALRYLDEGVQCSEPVIMQCYCHQIAYHIGDITYEELQERHRALSAMRPEYALPSQFSAVYVTGCYQLDYLCRCSGYDEDTIHRQGVDIIQEVMAQAKTLVNPQNQQVANYYILMFVNAASNVVDFEYFRDTILDVTVFANKSLYIHTMMVKEISEAITKEILLENPAYFIGVAAMDLPQILEHPEEILSLMADCALFHDIGKYFCLDLVSNSFRRLGDEEFECIKWHAFNFEKVYQGKLTDRVRCIRDCAQRHHLWYNEEAGYMEGYSHTENKPLVNILSIADSIDAATDLIGRPYGSQKTLDELISEFEKERDSRYSGYVIDVLKQPEIKAQIGEMIDQRRKEINYQVYTGNVVRK